jgi:hypothetical protein
VSLPSVGIANTLGAYYGGTNGYSFTTAQQAFSATGGTHEFTIASPTSPTGYHKYHVFTSTGILTTTAPSSDAIDLSSLLVAGGGSGGKASPGTGGGGGGAGGLISRTGQTLLLPGGTYIITIGAGAAAVVSGLQTPGTQGTPSKISPPSPTASTFLEAIGGGYGNNPNDPSTINTPAGPGGSGGGYGGNPLRLGGGLGTPGQGYPGGNTSPYTFFGTGGGGGAGSVGGTAQAPFNGPPTYTNHPNGNGGNGLPNSTFSSPFLSGYVPTIPPTSLSAIGPTGLYAGGGGGGGYTLVPNFVTYSGEGGPGGGGKGGQASQPITPLPSIDSESGQQNTGGGGGGACISTPQGSSGAGGSGVFMIRYAVTAP